MHRLKFLISMPFVLGCLAVAFSALGLVYYERDNESRGLASQIMVVRSSLAKPLPDIGALQARLAEVSGESEAILSSLPSSGQGIDVYAALVALGRSQNVDIARIESSAPIVKKEGPGSKSTLPYSATVTGDQGAILTFIESLTQGTRLLQGLEIRNVSIKTAPSGEGDNTAELDLYVHTWPDASQTDEAPDRGPGSTK